MSGRLLYLFWEFPKLSETFILDEIRWLGRRGFTIDILTKRIDPGLLRASTDLSLEMIMPLRRVRAGFLRRPALAQVGALVVNRLSHARKFRLAQVPPQAYQAIIAHFGPMAVTACALRRQLGLDAPIIGIFHGYDMSKYVVREGSEVYRNSEIDVFMAISECWTKRLREMDIAGEKIVTNRLGVDPGFLGKLVVDRNRDGVKPRYHLVSAGRLVEKKGFEILLHALAHLCPDVRKQIRLEVIGGGEQRSSLSSLARELELDTIVSFSGPMSRAGLLLRVASADLFVLASRTASDGDMDGIPVVLMEAMALRVPVISTLHSGIPELIQDRVNGTLVPEGDARALAGAIAEFVRDPVTSQRLCDAAYDRIAGHFTLDRYGEGLSLLIDKASADHATGRPGLNSKT